MDIVKAAADAPHHVPKVGACLNEGIKAMASCIFLNNALLDDMRNYASPAARCPQLKL